MTSSRGDTCEKMLVACRVYHSVTAWVALVKFRKVHTVPLTEHCGGQEGLLWGRGLLAGPLSQPPGRGPKRCQLPSPGCTLGLGYPLWPVENVLRGCTHTAAW